MYQIGICDDDKRIIETIEQLIQERYRVQIRKYVGELELQEEVRKGHIPYEILIMDIRLIQCSGIQLARQIQEISSVVKIIFITGYTDYVSDIFLAEPTYLLIKPIVPQKLYQALDKAIERLESERTMTIELCYKDSIYRVRVNDILYVESDKRYLNIYTKEQKIRVIMKMSELLSQLPDTYLRCHQSYAVNMDKVRELVKNEITLINGSTIAVSRSRALQVKKQLLDYFGGKACSLE